MFIQEDRSGDTREMACGSSLLFEPSIAISVQVREHFRQSPHAFSRCFLPDSSICGPSFLHPCIGHQDCLAVGALGPEPWGKKANLVPIICLPRFPTPRRTTLANHFALLPGLRICKCSAFDLSRYVPILPSQFHSGSPVAGPSISRNDKSLFPGPSMSLERTE